MRASSRRIARIAGKFVQFGVCSVLLVAPSAGARPATSPGGFDLQAHRGGRGETTEESLRGFAKSLELGVSTLEFDVVLTRDRHPMVWHDPVIAPEKCVDTAPAFPADPNYPYVGKLVHDLTFAQLRTLNCGQPLAEFPAAEVVLGNKIATLPEVFALADEYRADVRYNIETKVEADRPDTSATPQEFVEVILASIRSAGKIGAVEIQSFDWRTLPLVREVEPGVPLVALWDRTTWTPGSPWLAGINPAVTADPITAAATVGATVLAPEHSLIDREFVDRAHAAGFKVISWTVNDAVSMRTQIAVGVDGIITDYPALARTVLAELAMPLPPAYQRG